MTTTKIIKASARNSKLAVAQTNKALQKISKLLPSIEFESHWLTTTGDRDQKQDLKTSAANFFTDDLDSRVINGEFDCAVHSAKDLPEVIDPLLDWFWLPWREDPRDVLVLNKKFEMHKGNIVIKGTDEVQSYSGLKIGISSDRREEYCSERFPTAELLSIRGNIDGRIAQLDEGKYDMIIMAAAGLKRLDFENRIDEFIELSDLRPPDGQGYLAITFRKGDPIFIQMRKLFTKEVVFAGSGPGAAALAPLATVNALKNCEICLYDALSPIELLSYLPKIAQAVYVGKRSGLHSKNQSEICLLIEEYVKQGKAIVRLKGGDPGIFGRLAEEVEVMDENQIGFSVIPASSSLSAATTGTGLLLTRRDVSRGFRVLTPCRKQSDDFHALDKVERSKMPMVFFMGITKVADIVKELKIEGVSGSMQCALVFSAGTETEKVITTNLDDAVALAAGKHPDYGPGLFIVGETTNAKYLYKNHGIFADEKILVTGSSIVQGKSSDIISRNGGRYVGLPTIYLHADKRSVDILKNMADFDWLVITSPAAVNIFLDLVQENKIDMRTIPKILTCGPGTSAPFKARGIYPDAEAPNDFGVKGILETATGVLKPDDSVLRLGSNLSGPSLADSIRELCPDVVDTVLYNNIPCEYEECPDFTTVFFASSSAVKSFTNQFGEEALENKIVVAIGEPTAKSLTDSKYKAKIVADVSTVQGSFDALSAYLVNQKLVKI